MKIRKNSKLLKISEKERKALEGDSLFTANTALILGVEKVIERYNKAIFNMPQCVQMLEDYMVTYLHNYPKMIITKSRFSNSKLQIRE
jgi:hypothetical protein